MATLVLGVAASAIATQGIGLAAGGIAATAIGAVGAAVGSYIDNAFLFPALFNEGSQEQRFGSIRLASAEEGTPIWRCHGRLSRIPGLMVYASPSRPLERQQRVGKRQEVTQVTHYADAAWTFGRVDGGLTKVNRVLFDGQTVYDPRDPYTLSSARYGEDFVFVYDRNVRSVLTVASQPVIADWEMFIQTAPEWGASILISSIARVRVTRPGGFFDVYRITLSSSHGLTVGQTSLIRFTGSFGGGATDWSRSPYRWATAHTGTQLDVFATAPGEPQSLGTVTASSAVQISTDRRSPLARELRLSKFDVGGEPVSIQREGGGGPIEWVRFFPESVSPGPNGIDTARLRLAPSRPGATQVGSPVPFMPRFVESQQGGPFTAGYPILPSGLESITLSQARQLWDTDVFEDPIPNTEWTWINAVAGGGSVRDQLPSSLLTSLIGEILTPGYRRSPLLVAREVNLSKTNNRLGNPEALIEAADVALGDVIRNILTVRGMASGNIDVSDLSGINCEGYAYSGNVEGGQALQPLLIAYDVLVQETSSGIRFFRRKNATVTIVDQSEWDARPSASGGAGPRLIGRDAEGDRPMRSLSVTYYDIDEDLKDGSVTHVDQSIEDGEGEERSLRLPLTLSQAEAYEIARRIVRQSKSNRIEWSGVLPSYFDYIQESDIIQTTIDGALIRFLVLRVDIDSTHRVVVTGVQEQQGIGETVVNQSPSGGPYTDEPGGVATTSPMQARIIEQSWRSDRPSWAGYHVAASPTDGSRFQGAAIYRSTDDGTSWAIVGRVEAPATLGFVLGGAANILPQAEAQQVSFTFEVGGDSDEVGIEIDLVSGELESTTAAQAASGARGLALIGDEFVGIQTAGLRGQTTYVVTNIHRGLLGSGTASHGVADPVTLIDDALVWLPHGEADYGKRHLVKVVAPGQTLDDVQAMEVDVAPSSDHEPATPYDVRGLRATDTSDGLLLEWDVVDDQTVERYEVRRGPFWHGGEVVARTDANFLTLRSLPPGERTYHVRAQFQGGLYSGASASATITPADVENVVFADEAIQTSVPSPPPLDGDPVQWTARGLELDTGDIAGTYTLAPEINAGSVANWHWSVEVDRYRVDDRPLDVQSFAVDSIEAKVWSIAGRPTSQNHPGASFDLLITDESLQLSDRNIGSHGWLGSWGELAQVRVECRFDVDGLGTWTSWAPFREGIRRAQKMQTRLLFDRVSDEHAIVVTAIRVAARA